MHAFHRSLLEALFTGHLKIDQEYLGNGTVTRHIGWTRPLANSDRIGITIAIERRGHPLGRGSNRKSVSVPILFLSVSPIVFNATSKVRIDSSLLFRWLESESRCPSRASDPVSHPSGSSASLRPALRFRAERSPNSRDLPSVRSSLSSVLFTAALRRGQATTFRRFAFGVRPILITRDPENIQCRAVFIQFYKKDGLPHPASAGK
jgi:hypothetical protein